MDGMTLSTMSTVLSQWQKKLCAIFDKKYKTEDVGTKKFVVGRFLKYKMVNRKTVISQVQEF